MLRSLIHSKNQLKFGAIISYVNILVTIAVSLIYTPFLLRVLGQGEYGLFSIGFSAIGVFAILDFGFGNAIIRYTAKYRTYNNKNKEHSLYGMFFVMYLFLGILVLILGWIVYINASDIFGNNMTYNEILRLKQMLIFVIPSAAITLPLGIFSLILHGYEEFVLVRLISLLKIIFIPLISVFILKLGYKAVAVIAVISLLNILLCILSMYYAFRYLKIKLNFFDFDKNLLKEIVRYSSFVALAAIASRIDYNSNQFIISLAQGTKSVAIYAVGFVMVINLKSVSDAISALLLPALAKIPKDENQLKIYNSYFTSVGRMQFYLILLFYLGFALFGKQFIILWAGPEYELSYYVCLLLISALSIFLIQEVGVTILQAQNKHQFYSVLVIILSIGNIILSSFLSGIYGSMGATISLTGFWLIGHGIIMNIYYHKKAKLNVIRFWVQISKIIPALIIPVIYAILYLHFYNADTWLKLAIGISGFLILYGLSAITITFNKFEKELLIEPLLRYIKKKLG